MGECTNGYEINPGFGDCPHPVNGDISGRLGNHLTPCALHCLFHILEGHVIQHYHVGTGSHGLGEVIKIFHFYLYPQEMVRFTSVTHRTSDASRSFYVIVFYQYPVVETKAVIGASSHSHGVFLHEPQSWCRFSRLYNHCPRSLHLVDECIGEGCDSRNALEHIETHPLTREERSRVPIKLGDNSTL